MRKVKNNFIFFDFITKIKIKKQRGDKKTMENKELKERFIDKKGNDIDKLACSEFWKEKDSYRRLPNVPDITDININRLSKKRDEKILENIIKPKYDLINESYQNNLLMHQQLLRQAKMVEEAEKYQKEKNRIIADNRDLHKQEDNIKAEYQQKENNLEWKYESRINKLEKENCYLHKVIDKFRETIHKFIEWICVNFDMGTGDTLIRDFEKETRTYLDEKEQIKREDGEKDLEYER